MKTSVLFLILVFIVLVLMVSQESYRFQGAVVDGWAKMVGTTDELGAMNTWEECAEKAENGKYTSWTYRKDNHKERRNTCVASRAECTDSKGTMDQTAHVSGCVNPTSKFPYCALPCSTPKKQFCTIM